MAQDKKREILNTPNRTGMSEMPCRIIDDPGKDIETLHDKEMRGRRVNLRRRINAWVHRS